MVMCCHKFWLSSSLEIDLADLMNHVSSSALGEVGLWIKGSAKRYIEVVMVMEV